MPRPSPYTSCCPPSIAQELQRARATLLALVLPNSAVHLRLLDAPSAGGGGGALGGRLLLELQQVCRLACESGQYES